MRYYEIRISPGVLSAKSFAPITFSTLTPGRTNNGSALSVDIDIFQTWYHQPAQNGYIKIKGVDFRDLNQSANFNNAKIRVSVGMSKGLPYAKPSQAGLIIDGTILQCFGNWLGSEVSLDFVIGSASYDPNVEVNLSFEWLAKTKNQTLQSAVENTIGKAYQGIPISGSFSPNLIYTEDQWGQYTSLLAFSKYINAVSKQIITSKNYQGASIGSSSAGFILADGTVPAPKTTKVEFTDIVGNLTWLNIDRIQAKLIMRSDLNVGDKITFPKGTPVLNVVNNYSQNRNNISFDGVFQIDKIRHIGSSRQADGSSWCTIVDAVIPGVLK